MRNALFAVFSVFLMFSGQAVRAADAEDEILQPARIFFQSKQYQPAFDQYMQYQEKFPEGEAVEETLHYLGRCKYGMAENDIKHLSEALKYFDKLLKDFPRGRLADETRYWRSRSWMKQAEAEKDSAKAKELYSKSVDEFKKVILSEGGVDIEYRSRYYQAVAYGLMAPLSANETERDSFYRKAISAFERLILDYPEHRYRPLAEADFIHYLVAIGEYDQAITRATEFEKNFSHTERYAGVLFNHAESLYYTGQINKAIDVYEHAYRLASQDDKMSRIEVSSRLGAGWSYSRLAANAPDSTKARYLAPAASAFRRALSKMSQDDLRYENTVYKLSEALLFLGGYNEALQLLEGLIRRGGVDINAWYLAGRAAVGLADYDKAYAFFDKSLSSAEDQERHEMILDCLESLAEIETHRNNFARSCLFNDAAARKAAEIQDFVKMAADLLGKARNLLELANRNVGNKSGSIADDTFKFLKSDANYDSARSRIRSKESIGLEVEALNKSSSEMCFSYAREILDDLASQHAERLRQDELSYYLGKGLADEAWRKASKISEPAEFELTDENCSSILTLFDSGKDHLGESLSANPRGAFAALSLFETGKALFRSGDFALKAAKLFALQGDKNLSQTYQDIAQGLLEEIEPYILQIPELAPQERITFESSYLLGLGYMLIQRNNRAEAVFREILADDNVGDKLRADTAGKLADVLYRMNRPEEAIETLQPYLLPGLSRHAVLQAGKIYAELGRLSQSYNTYMIINTFPEPSTQEDRDLQAEIFYNAFELAMRLAKSGDRYVDSEKLQKDAVEGLEMTATSYSNTPSAARALALLSSYYLERGEFTLASAKIEKGLRIFSSPDSRQEMHLLQGRIYLKQYELFKGKNLDKPAEKSLESAMEAFTKVKISRDTSSPRGRSLEAQAFLGLARCYAVSGKTDEAVRNYSSVFAFFPEIVATADRARLEAAELLLEKKEYVSALAILREARDKKLVQPLIDKLESLRSIAAPAVGAETLE